MLEEDGRDVADDLQLRPHFAVWLLLAAWSFTWILSVARFGFERAALDGQLAYGGFLPPIWEGEWWRLFSSLVLQTDVVDLIVGGIVLAVCGRWLEQRIGAVRLLVVYFLSGMCGQVVGLATTHELFVSTASGNAISTVPAGLAGLLAATALTLLVARSRFMANGRFERMTLGLAVAGLAWLALSMNLAAFFAQSIAGCIIAILFWGDEHLIVRWFFVGLASLGLAYSGLHLLRDDASQQVENLYTAALYFGETGDVAREQSMWSTLAHRIPHNRMQAYMVAQALLTQGDAKGARAFLSTFMEADAKDDDVRRQMRMLHANANAELGEFDAAVKEVDEVAKLPKVTWENLYLRARILFWWSREHVSDKPSRERQLAAWQAALEASNIGVQRDLTNGYMALVKDRDARTAEKCARNVLMERPHDTEALYLLGLALRQSGRRHDGDDYIQFAARLQPGDRELTQAMKK